MKEKFKIIIMVFIILESDNLKRMDDSVLFQLPPELLCGLLSKLPGEDLKQFGNSFYYFIGDAQGHLRAQTAQGSRVSYNFQNCEQDQHVED